jgi:hypothetical protein
MRRAVQLQKGSSCRLGRRMIASRGRERSPPKGRLFLSKTLALNARGGRWLRRLSPITPSAEASKIVNRGRGRWRLSFSNAINVSARCGLSMPGLHAGSGYGAEMMAHGWPTVGDEVVHSTLRVHSRFARHGRRLPADEAHGHT